MEQQKIHARSPCTTKTFWGLMIAKQKGEALKKASAQQTIPGGLTTLATCPPSITRSSAGSWNNLLTATSGANILPACYVEGDTSLCLYVDYITVPKPGEQRSVRSLICFYISKEAASGAGDIYGEAAEPIPLPPECRSCSRTSSQTQYPCCCTWLPGSSRAGGRRICTCLTAEPSQPAAVCRLRGRAEYAINYPYLLSSWPGLIHH